MELQYLRTICTVKVDGLKHVNHYEIREMFRVIDDGWAVDIEEKVVRSFDLTWSEISAIGGPGAVKQMIADQYEGIDFLVRNEHERIFCLCNC